MGSAKKILSGVFWTTFLNIVNGVYGFISVPILIAYFGKSEYGLIGLAMSINIYLRLMDMGLTSTNVRFFSAWISKGEKENVNRLFGTSLSFYGAIGLLNALILFGVSFFSQHIFNVTAEQDIIIKHLLYILAISAFISWFTSCFDQLIRGNELVGWQQKITLLPKLFQVGILVLTVTAGLSIEMYFALTTFSMFLLLPMMMHKISKLCPYVSFLPKFDKKIFREILPYSLNIFSFSLFQFSLYNLRPVFLGMQGTVESVADYRVLNGIVGIVMILGGSFMNVLLPSVTKAVSSKNRKAQLHVAYDGTKYISISLVFFSFGVISVCSELLNLYVGADYLYLTRWLSAWLIILTLSHNQAISALILAGTDIRAITYSSIVASVCGLAACWFAVPVYQVGGTIIAFGVYMSIQMLFYYLYYWPHRMHIDSKRVFWKCFAPYFILGFVSATIVSFISFNTIPIFGLFLIKGLCFVLIYLIGVWCLLTQNDKQFFMKLISKNKK